MVLVATDESAARQQANAVKAAGLKTSVSPAKISFTNISDISAGVTANSTVFSDSEKLQSDLQGFSGEILDALGVIVSADNEQSKNMQGR
ncbi:MAG: hypothetical protein LBI13_08805 [Streptococcaceae bacterium]|jgi:poly-gamma-glutamate capsule biosynthesis protein CapA/YwtB (metallophosphatase superfamily)|nr:hypothetical protein [Streptococcaceae bacterium]